jgi:hypothetical protein
MTEIRETTALDTLKAVCYAYSIDEESYSGSFASRQEALAAGMAERKEYLADEDGPVWTAVRIEADLAKIVQSMRDYDDTILEDLNETAGEDYGEYVNDWPETTAAQRQRLDETIKAAILAWLRTEGLTPAFFTIDSDTVERAR